MTAYYLYEYSETKYVRVLEQQVGAFCVQDAPAAWGAGWLGLGHGMAWHGPGGAWHCHGH